MASHNQHTVPPDRDKKHSHAGLIGFLVGLAGVIIPSLMIKVQNHLNTLDLMNLLLGNPFFYVSLIIPFLAAFLFMHYSPSRHSKVSPPRDDQTLDEFFTSYLSQWIHVIYDGAIILNEQFQVIESNQRATLLLRLHEKIMPETSLEKIIPERTVKKIKALVQEEHGNITAHAFSQPSKMGLQPDSRLGCTLARFQTGGKTGYLFLIHDLQTREETLVEIQRAKEYAQSIIDCSSEVIISVDLDRRITEFNHAAETAFGYKKKDVLDKSVSILYDDISQSEDVNVSLNSRGIVTREIKNRRKNGQVFYSTLSGSILRDSQGRPRGYMGVSRDISRQRASELALRENEERFRSLCASSPVGILQTDAEGNCTYVNQRWSEITGLAFEKSGQKEWMNVIHPDDRPNFLSFWSHEMNRLTTRTIESRILTPGENIRWILWRTSPIKTGAEPEEISGTVNTIEDITERKWAEIELTKDRRFLRELVSKAPVAMAMLDHELKFISYSRQWLQDHPSIFKSLSGIDFQTAYPKFSSRFKTILDLGLRGESLSSSEEKFTHQDDTTTHLRWAVTPWHQNEGKTSGILVVTDNVSDIVAAREKALEAARMKSRFLANMSHEIRTPMNGVIGVTDLILNTPLSDHQESLINIIRSSAETLLKIIDDILDFSKVEAGHMEVEKRPFDLHKAVHETFILLQSKALSKNLTFTLKISPQCPLFVIGDIHRLKQVLLNLIGNAVKFTESGHVSVTLEVVGNTEPVRGCEIEFCISDSGPGIPAEKRNKLFQPFSQIDSSITRQFGGTGLGLAISLKLVELMQGTLGVRDTRLHTGCEFYFRLPFLVVEQNALPLSQSNSKQFNLKRESTEHLIDREMSRKYPLKILIVEDNALNRQIINLYLVEMGYHPETVISGEECLEKVKATFYDLILMDIQMPGLDGIEVAKIILARQAADQNPHKSKIVALTAHAGEEDREQCLQAGFSGYITKPLRTHSLEKTIHNLFSATSSAPDPHTLLTHSPPVDTDTVFWRDLIALQDKGQKGLIRETIDLFIEHAKEQIDKLSGAVSQKHSEQIAQYAHSLRGGALNFGADRFCATCALMEENAGRDEMEGIDELLVKLIDEFSELKVDLKKIKESHK